LPVAVVENESDSNRDVSTPPGDSVTLFGVSVNPGATPFPSVEDEVSTPLKDTVPWKLLILAMVSCVVAAPVLGAVIAAGTAFTVKNGPGTMTPMVTECEVLGPVPVTVML